MKAPQRFAFTPIGVVRSPYTETKGMPIQPMGGAGVMAEVVVDEAYAEGLKDLDGFSHIYLLYVFHRAAPRGFEAAELTVVPFADNSPRGVFATRAPNRPNPIGLSLVRLTGRIGAILRIESVDILDGTPVLDIKPFIPALEPKGDITIGWLEGKAEAMGTLIADDRFRGRGD